MSREYLEKLEVDDVRKECFALHLKLEPFSTKWHQHSKHQLVYAEGGVLYFQSEEHTFILPARFCAWIPSGSFHRLSSQAAALHLRTIYFGEQDGEQPFYKKLNVFPVSNLALEMILQTRVWTLDDKEDEVQRVFFDAIRLMVPSWGLNPIPLILPVPEHRKLKEVTDFIGEHAGECMQLDSTAKQFGLSERTLMRLFRKQLGMTFSAYVRVARIIKALELLAQPGASVADTAYAVGFESLGSFSDTFCRLIRMRPSEYRKSAQNSD